MKKDVKYWQAYKRVSQLSFDGSNVFVDIPVGEFHAIRGTYPLCRENLEVVEKKLSANGHKISSTLPSSKMCEKCKEEMKGAGSDWHRWISGSPIKGGKTPKVLHDI